MAQLGNVLVFRTDKDEHFTSGIIQNAQEQENIALPEGIAAGRHCRCRIKWINIISTDQRAWEIWLWGDQNGSSPADQDDIEVLGRWSFASSDGVQIAGAGNYYYYIDGLDVVYEDTDGGADADPALPGANHAGGQLHVSLVNRSAAAKTSLIAGGYIVVIFGLEPVVGW